MNSAGYTDMIAGKMSDSAMLGARAAVEHINASRSSASRPQLGHGSRRIWTHSGRNLRGNDRIRTITRTANRFSLRCARKVRLEVGLTIGCAENSASTCATISGFMSSRVVTARSAVNQSGRGSADWPLIIAMRPSACVGCSAITAILGSGTLGIVPNYSGKPSPIWRPRHDNTRNYYAVAGAHRAVPA